MKKLLLAIAAAFFAFASPAAAQQNTVKICVPTTGTACPVVSASAPLPVTGSFSATLSGFTPNGNYGSLTATAASSASTALPAGTVVAFQNLSTIDVSCVLTAGASTATTNKIIVRGGATVFVTVGSNTTTACINQTGVASNVVALMGGSGLGTNFGGGGAGGGGGGAVTMASGAVASGAYSSGSIASGAYASGSIASGAFASGAVSSGAYASGSLASGAVVDITNLSTPIAAGAATATKGILLGGQYDTTQKTLTNGQQAALSTSPRGALYVATGAENLVVVGAGTAGSASGGVLTVQGSASGTAIPISGTVTATPTGTQAVSIASAQVASGAYASGALASGSIASGAMVDLGAQADAVCGSATGTCSLIALVKYLNTAANSAIPAGGNLIGDVNLRQGGNALSTTNGIYSNLLQGNAVISATNGLYSNLLQGNAVISATNGLYANVLQGNAVLSATNPSFSRPTDGTNARVFDPCEYGAHTRWPVSINTAATTVVVAGTSAKKTYICSMMLFSAGTTNVGIVEGNGTTCGTGTAGLIGGATSGTGPNLTAQAGFVAGDGQFSIAGTTTNANDICLINSQAIQVSGYIVTATP